VGSWLVLGLLFGLAMGPYQALSELGFRIQVALWLSAEPQSLLGCLLVFGATSLLVLLAWGPLAGGRGGGTASLLALDRASQSEGNAVELLWLQQLNLATQLHATFRLETYNALGMAPASFGGGQGRGLQAGTGKQTCTAL